MTEYVIAVAVIYIGKIKTSQGNIFTAPTASGEGLTDLILRCLVFWFGFRCSSIEEGRYLHGF